MKITMKTSEEKGGSSTSTCNSNSNCSNSKIRIAVFGQHDVGKSALTVRYLTRRYIGEYKSNTDLLYRQTLSVSHGTSLDIEIVDISTSEGPDSSERKTFPQEEIHRADGFVIVYSITDRNSFTFALEALSDIYNCYNTPQPSTNSTPTSSSNQNSPNSSPQPKATCPVALVANKNDLEHLRAVDKIEGISASLQYGCQFYELSVAENSPEVYQSFQTIITTLMTQFQHCQPSKRKFSVSKMLGNLRLGRTSPSNSLHIVTSQASIVDTNVITNSNSTTAKTQVSQNRRESKGESRESSPFSSRIGKLHQLRHSSNSSSQSQQSDISSTSSSSSSSSSGSGNCNNLSSSICHLKSKLVEFHSMKKRHNSPPICSL